MPQMVYDQPKRCIQSCGWRPGRSARKSESSKPIENIALEIQTRTYFLAHTLLMIQVELPRPSMELVVSEC